MTTPGSILRRTEAGWQIAEASTDAAEWHSVAGPDPLDAEQIALAVANFVTSANLNDNVSVLLDSKSVLVASVSVSNRADLRNHEVLSYRLEELLPIAAEHFAADYIVNDDNDVLGIATRTSELLPLVTALESKGLQVQSISPSAVLAFQSYSQQSEPSSRDILVWQDGQGLEVFHVGKRLQNWRHLPAEASSLNHYLAAEQLRHTSPLRVALIGVASDIVSNLAQNPDIEVTTTDTLSLSEQARSAAVSVLQGKTRPWCELRRGKLAAGDPHRGLRREREWSQWGLVLLLVVMAYFFWMRGRRYESRAEELNARQIAVFQEVFPSSRPPSAVVSRLRSERTKLSGARGKEAAVEQPTSALNVLYELLAGFPEDLRLQVQQLRIEDGSIYLDARVRTVGHAGELADALKQHGFSIEPPTTEQHDAKQVSVRINGKLSHSGEDAR